MHPSAFKNDWQEQKWIEMEDFHATVTSMPSYRNILFSDSRTKLLDCISSIENPNTLQKFLRNIADINTALPSDSHLWPGCTPLHLAVMFSKNRKDKDQIVHLVNQLLNHGASVQVQNQRGATPLHLAFRLELQDIVALLMRRLQKNPNKLVNLLDDENLSYLHIFCTASDHRSSLARKLLLDEQKIKSTVNSAYKGQALTSIKPGWTPLHVAVAQSQLSLVELLLQRGANAVSADFRGCTPIHLLFGVATAKPFADLLFASEQLTECVVEGFGLSHLHLAVHFNDRKSMERLLDLGANIEVSIRMTEDGNLKEYAGYTPLRMAMLFNHQALVKILLRRGADVLAECLHDGTTPLSEALTGGHSGIASTFVKSLWSDDKLQKRLEEELGLTMLHVASYSGDFDRAEAELMKGACVKARLHDTANFWPGYTPLHALIAREQQILRAEVEKIFLLLVARGGDINQQDKSGQTAFHLALASKGVNYNKEALVIFIWFGADINIVDGHGKTPTSYALDLYSHCEGDGNFREVMSMILQLFWHVRKIKLVGMDVIEQDVTRVTVVLQKHNWHSYPCEMLFCDQVQATESMNIGQRGLSLRSFLCETGALSRYPSLTPEDRLEVAAFFGSFDYLSFPDLSPLIRLQYRKAVARLSLIDPAREALKTFMCSNFPDLCIDIILKYLSNANLKQLIAASIDDADV